MRVTRRQLRRLIVEVESQATGHSTTTPCDIYRIPSKLSTFESHLKRALRLSNASINSAIGPEPIFVPSNSRGGGARVIANLSDPKYRISSQKMTQQDFENIITKAGYVVVGRIAPKMQCSSSGSYWTYVFKDPMSPFPEQLLRAVFGTRDPEAKEKIQMGEINSAIKNAGGVVNIYRGPNRPPAMGVVRAGKATPNTKPDLELFNKDDQVIATVSLKSADYPHQMSQWGGVGGYKGKKGEPITDPEVRKFVDDIRQFALSPVSGEMPSSKTYRRNIKDTNIKQKAVYGYNDEVDIVIASKKPILFKKQKNGLDEFTGTNVWYFPNIPGVVGGYDWTPSLIARRGDANYYGLPRARVGIFPWGYARSNNVNLNKDSQEYLNLVNQSLPAPSLPEPSLPMDASENEDSSLLESFIQLYLKNM